MNYLNVIIISYVHTVSELTTFITVCELRSAYLRKLHFMYELVRGSYIKQIPLDHLSYIRQMPLEHLSYIKESSWNTSGGTWSRMEYTHCVYACGLRSIEANEFII